MKSKNLLAFLVGLLLAVSVVPSFAAYPCMYNTIPISDLSAWYLDTNQSSTSMFSSWGATYSNSYDCSLGSGQNYYKHNNNDPDFHLWEVEMGALGVCNGSSGLTYGRSRQIRIGSTSPTCPIYEITCPTFDRFQAQIFAPTGLFSCVDTCMNNTVDMVQCTSSNGVKDADEVGIDCGGSSPKVCQTYCPIGFHLETRTNNGFTADMCYSDDSSQYTVDANSGICPSGYYKSNTDTNKCVESYIPTIASGDYLDSPTAPPLPTPPVVTNPWNEQTETTNTTNTTNTSTDPVNNTTTTVDNRTTTTNNFDGSTTTSTTTTTTVLNTVTNESTVTTQIDNYTTNPPGSPGGGLNGNINGTSTTTNNYYDSDGNETGSDTQTTAIESQSGLTVAAALPTHGTPAGDVNAAQVNQFSDRLSTFTDAIAAAPVFSAFDEIFAGPSGSGSPTIELNFGSYGNPGFDLTQYEDVFINLGYIFIFLAFVTAGKLVVVNKG